MAESVFCNYHLKEAVVYYEAFWQMWPVWPRQEAARAEHRRRGVCAFDFALAARELVSCPASWPIHGDGFGLVCLVASNRRA